MPDRPRPARPPLPLVLVPGGAGYIGSHVVLALLQTRRYRVAVLDNLSNAHIEVLGRICHLARDALPPDASPAEQDACRPEFILGDLRDRDHVRSAFARYGPGGVHAVVLLAALKSPVESFQVPLAYYDVNLCGTIHLVTAMTEYRCPRLVYSSSATVYGTPHDSGSGHSIPETTSFNPTNVYGRTKVMSEQVIEDCCKAYPLRAISLRYFNPGGAHPSGLMGEDPLGKPSNLLPRMLQTAMANKRSGSGLLVFGDDYDTPDGTCIRDFIYIMDLAQGHIKALEGLEDGSLFRPEKPPPASTPTPGTPPENDEGPGGYRVYNLGTGQGYSVLQVIETMSRLVGSTLPFQITSRREGDIGCVTANPSLARKDLGFQAQSTLDDMIRSMLLWAHLNPQGYKPSPPLPQQSSIILLQSHLSLNRLSQISPAFHGQQNGMPSRKGMEAMEARHEPLRPATLI